MSVLNVPRLFLKGSFYWNPCTTNNNDQWSTYDFPNAALNWAFLATQDPPITQRNLTAAFKPWVLTQKDFPNSQNPQYQQPPAEWNYYGGNDCGLVNTGTPALHAGDSTVITGGQTDYGQDPSASGDPVVGLPVQLDKKETPSPYKAPKMVDVNPDSFWCTQVILNHFIIGDPSTPDGPSLSADVPPGLVMDSRWIYFKRNLNVTGTVQIAGVGGATFQISVPAANFGVNPQGSTLLGKLNDLKSAGQGLMIRLTTYTTIYFSSEQILEAAPDLASCQPLTGNDKLQCQYEKLTALWHQQLEAGHQPSQNPAIGTVVGSIGPYDNDELATAPQGRYLVTNNSLSPTNAGSNNSLVPLAPAVAKLNTDSQGNDWVSVDLSATTSEIDPQNTKADYGDLQLSVRDSVGTYLTIGTLSPDQYNQAAYDATAGIRDFPLSASPDKVTAAHIQAGRLALRGQQNGTLVDGLSETVDKLTVETDQRGVYVDEGRSGSCTVQVRYNGLPFSQSPPRTDVRVLLVQYQPDPPPPQANGGAWKLVAPGEGSVALEQDFLYLPRDGDGTATFKFDYKSPGFPIIVFFPHYVDESPKTPPQVIPPLSDPSKPITGPNELILSAFYMNIRCLPANNGMPQAFINLWNSTRDPERAWEFVYYNVFYLYDMVFPVMQYYGGINFGDMDSVIKNWPAIASQIEVSQINSTAYMPVTRQLSAGARYTLQLWGYLVTHHFEIGELDPRALRDS